MARPPAPPPHPLNKLYRETRRNIRPNHGLSDNASFVDGSAAPVGGHSPRPPRDSNNTDGRSEFGGVSPRSPGTNKSQLGLSAGGSFATLAAGAPTTSAAGAGAAGPGAGAPGVRPRGVRLTAVTFAANAPVLAVGERTVGKIHRETLVVKTYLVLLYPAVGGGTAFWCIFNPFNCDGALDAWQTYGNISTFSLLLAPAATKKSLLSLHLSTCRSSLVCVLPKGTLVDASTFTRLSEWT